MDRFGAIAFSQSQNTWGGSHSYFCAEEANQAALTHCANYKGTACKIVATVKNKCTAIAVGPSPDNFFMIGEGTNRDSAEKDAMRKCGSVITLCKPLAYACSGG